MTSDSICNREADGPLQGLNGTAADSVSQK